MPNHPPARAASPTPKERIVEGEVERITFESAATGFRVLKVAIKGERDRIAVVGTFPPVPVGALVRVHGTTVMDAKHGEQLRAESLTQLAPSTLLGLKRYLGSGWISGIGESYANRIVDRFGHETLRVLEEQPERLAEVEGLGKKRITAITGAWKDQRLVRDIMVFLQAHGASASLATRILKRYGSQATHVVSSEPYRLAIEVWGIGFKTADRIAADLGVARDSPQRMQAGVLQTLHDMTEAGHVFATPSELISNASSLLELNVAEEGTAARLEHAISALAAAKHVVIEGETPRAIFSTEMYNTETRLASRVAALSRVPSKPLPGALEAIAAFEDREQMALASEQRDAVCEAARAQLIVVTGGPGVGKTTIVRAILAVFDRAGLETRLAAPTGRAAKRLSESTGKDAMTLHRLLEFDPKKGEFKRNAERPVEAGALIVDEASMLDLKMADALFQAVAEGARVVLVGDVDQLPSIGPGAVLRDLLAVENIARVRLTKIFRQAQRSRIVVNAHRIHAGEAPIGADAKEDGADFFIVERRDGESARDTVVELVTKRIPRRFGLDPIRDIQVLTPMHRGPAGSTGLNEALQAALNPAGEGITRGARTFRVGDKVMQLKNDYDREIFNGDVGIISAVDVQGGTLDVRFDGGSTRDAQDKNVSYDAASLDQLALSYACTIHKSQGSEYPAVVIPFLTAHFVMLSRNLLYTAVTRGKRLVVLVSDPRAVALALQEERKGERRTRLTSRIESINW